MFLKCDYGNRKMFQWLRVLAALPQDWVRVPASTWWLTTTFNFSSKGYNGLFWPPWVLHTCGTQIYRQAKHSDT